MQKTKESQNNIGAPSPEDLTAARSMLGRPARSVVAIAARCHLGLPVVFTNSPFLQDGSPFPTLYWLSCPELVKRVSRLEASGMIDHLENEVAADPGFERELTSAYESYSRLRRSFADREGPSLETGVGGVREPATIKCLHAHLAHYLAGHANPVGERIAILIDTPDCEERCIE